MAIVHIINNEVSRALVADGVLAYGGSPMMSENVIEFDAIHQHAGALVINLGMIGPEKKIVISNACKSAVTFGIPIGIDPVGIHMSPWRFEVFRELIAGFKIAYVKGNQDEIYCAIFGSEDGLEKSLESKRYHEPSVFRSKLLDSEIVWLISGEQDQVVGKGRCEIVSGGTPDLRKISGAGCLLSGLVAVNLCKGMDVFDAAHKASRDLKKASEGSKPGGIGMLKMKIIDGLETVGDSSV